MITFLSAMIIIFGPYAFYLSIKVANLYRVEYDGFTLGEFIAAVLLVSTSIIPFWNILVINVSIETLREAKIKFIDVGKIKNWKFFNTKFFKP